MTIDFDGIEYLTFDCYGTVIDWETGITESLAPILRRHGWTDPEDPLLERYAEFEAQLEAGPYIPYREVLRRVVDRFGYTLGFEPSEEERSTFSGSVGAWPPFADSRTALASLARRFKLVVLSNVDDDLFAGSDAQLGSPFYAVFTAQQIRAYKPDPRNFRFAVEKLGGQRNKICHVAQSLFHDIAPANQLGLRTVWINRRHGREGPGATPFASAQPNLELPSLAAFVTHLRLDR